MIMKMLLFIGVFVLGAIAGAVTLYQAAGTPIPDRIAAAIATLPAGKPTAEEHRASRWDKAKRLKLGDPAPLLTLQLIDGRTLDLRRKVVVLNFFATWCGPCMTEMPRLEKDVWAPLQDKGVILVAIGRGHSASELEVFRKEKHFSFPFVSDPKNEIYNQFANDYIPRCVLIGKDGQIKYQTVGFVLEEYRGSWRLFRVKSHDEIAEPAAGKAGSASRLRIGHHWPGVPEPGRSALLCDSQIA